MRRIGNFHLEWGGSEQMPTLRIVLVASAIGAVGSSAVILSLTDASVTTERAPHSAQAVITNAAASSPAQIQSMQAAPIGSRVTPPAPGVLTTNIEPRSNAQSVDLLKEDRMAHRAKHWWWFRRARSLSDGSIRSER